MLVESLNHSLVAERVTKDLVNHFENVLSPATLDRIHLHVVTKAVAIWDVRELDVDFARVIKGDEFYDAVRVVLPFLELPLHLD